MAATNSSRAQVVYDDYGIKEYKTELCCVEIFDPERPGSLINKGLIFVIDISDSMNDDNRLSTVKIGMKTTLDLLIHKVSNLDLDDVETMPTQKKIKHLSEIGYIAFITFAREINFVWDNGSSENPYELISNLRGGDSTNLYGGVSMALSKCLEVKQPCTVIILTDGDANLGYTDEASFKSLYSKFPSTSTLLSVGVGNDYRSKLLSISPVSFTHTLRPTQMIEFMGSVVSDFILSIGICGKLELIDLPCHRSLIGDSELGTLIQGRKRTIMFSVYPSSKYPTHDPKQRISEKSKIRLSFQRFDGSLFTKEYPIERIEKLNDEWVEDYYREEAVRLISYVSQGEVESEEVERVVIAWDRPNAEAYCDAVLKFIDDKKRGSLSHEERDVQHMLSQFSSQNSRGSPSLIPILTPKTEKSEIQKSFSASASKKNHDPPSPDSRTSRPAPSLLPSYHK